MENRTAIVYTTGRDSRPRCAVLRYGGRPTKSDSCLATVVLKGAVSCESIWALHYSSRFWRIYFAGRAPADELILAENGQSAYRIVVAENASPSTKHGAEELQMFCSR